MAIDVIYGEPCAISWPFDQNRHHLGAVPEAQQHGVLERSRTTPEERKEMNSLQAIFYHVSERKTGVKEGSKSAYIHLEPMSRLFLENKSMFMQNVSSNELPSPNRSHPKHIAHVLTATTTATAICIAPSNSGFSATCLRAAMALPCASASRAARNFATGG